MSEGWTAFRDEYFPNDPLRRQALDLHHAADRGLIRYEEFEQGIADLADVSLSTVRQRIDRNQPNLELFEYIKRELRPAYKLGMLSNAADNWLADFFTPDQLVLFETVVLSYEAKVAKPDAAAYQMTADRLGVLPEECVLIDDTQSFCTAARDVGMQAIWYKNVAQCKAELGQVLERYQ